MKFVAKAQERREQDVNMMMRGFVKIQTAKVLCLRLQCLERIRADVLKFTTGTKGQVNKMSDDLISRKAVIEAIDRHTREDGTLDNDISVILEEVETAFDKEKVIEELEYDKGMSAKYSTGLREQGHIEAFDEAISIVKKGGINNILL